MGLLHWWHRWHTRKEYEQFIELLDLWKILEVVSDYLLFPEWQLRYALILFSSSTSPSIVRSLFHCFFDLCFLVSFFFLNFTSSCSFFRLLSQFTQFSALPSPWRVYFLNVDLIVMVYIKNWDAPVFVSVIFWYCYWTKLQLIKWRTIKSLYCQRQVPCGIVRNHRWAPGITPLNLKCIQTCRNAFRHAK